MSVDRDDTADRIRGSLAGLELSRIETGLRVVAAVLLLAIAVIGLQHEEPVVLWLVPVAWVLLTIDPPRER